MDNDALNPEIKLNSSENIKLNQQKSEIDLRELFTILWKGKWWIITVAIISGLVFSFIALKTPNEYKATALVQPNKAGNNNKMRALAGQLGGFASLAGINLGANGSTDALIAIEVIKSWGFAESFIKKHQLEKYLLAVEGWDEGNDKLIYNRKIYDSDSKKWLLKNDNNNKPQPSSWMLYREYKNRLSISEDKKTGLINISFSYYSPSLAKQWVDLLIKDINSYMKERALDEANKSVKYLELQIQRTSVAELRTVFSQLIQEQYKTKMLAQISPEFVFKTIAHAKQPEVKDSPKRLLIVFWGVVLGGIFGVFIALILHFIGKRSK